MASVEGFQEDLKQAMRDRDELRRDTLRLVIADLKYKRIELGHELSEAEIEGVLRSAVKRRQDSVEQYEKAERAELAERERSEIGVIEGYLPQQMSEQETDAAVRAIAEELGADSKKDTGRVMKALMARYQGRVDGRTANRILSEILE